MRQMYVASIRLDVLKEGMEYTEGNLITRGWTRNLITLVLTILYLSRETHAKYAQ